MRNQSPLKQFAVSERAVSSTECALLLTLFVVTFIGMITGYVSVAWFIAPTA